MLVPSINLLNIYFGTSYTQDHVKYKIGNIDLLNSTSNNNISTILVWRKNSTGIWFNSARCISPRIKDNSVAMTMKVM